MANEGMEKNKGFFIIGAMVLLALFVGNNIFKQQNEKYNMLKENIRVEVEKSSSLDRIVVANEKIKKARERGWVSLDSNQMVARISELAFESQIKITNISPQDKRVEKNYILVPFMLNGEASYGNILRFVTGLEANKMLFRVRSLTIGASDKSRGGEKNANLPMSLTVEAVFFK